MELGNYRVNDMLSYVSTENKDKIDSLANEYIKNTQDRQRIIEDIKNVKNAEFEKLNIKEGDYFEYSVENTKSFGKIEKIDLNSWALDLVTIKFHGIIFHWKSGFNDNTECRFNIHNLNLYLNNFNLLNKITKEEFDKKVDQAAMEIKNVVR